MCANWLENLNRSTTKQNRNWQANLPRKGPAHCLGLFRLNAHFKHYRASVLDSSVSQSRCIIPVRIAPRKIFERVDGWRGMKRALWFSAIILLSASGEAASQSDLQKAQNLATCLEGRYPRLCHKDWLNPDERQKTAVAEERENLRTCLTGKYPALCNKALLSSDEAREVAAAEKRDNLDTCLTGRYRSLCKKQMLSQSELTQVLAAERSENLHTCLTGRFPSLCDHALLTSSQAEQAKAAEAQAAQQRSTTARTRPARRSGSSGCESGHWIDSVSDDGEIVKLEDGSVWEVDAGDNVDSALWLPTTEIVACDGKLINTDDNEKVSATRLK